MIEVVPLIVKQANLAAIFQVQANPVHVIPFELKHLVELLFGFPVLQPGAVEQHDAAGQGAALALVTGFGTAHQRFAGHIATQQFPGVTDGEYIRVDNNRPPLIAHQFGRHETQRGEGLQVVVQPFALVAVAQVQLTFLCLEESVVPDLDESHIELVAVG